MNSESAFFKVMALFQRRINVESIVSSLYASWVKSCFFFRYSQVTKINALTLNGTDNIVSVPVINHLGLLAFNNCYSSNRFNPVNSELKRKHCACCH